VGWVTQALAELSAGRSATVRPRGHSMRGRINDGELVTLIPAVLSDIDVGDAVLVKWRRGYLLHLVKAIRRDQYQIGNNVGGINGWVSGAAIKGKVVAVER
jgi:hypothetical protein